MGPLCFGGLTLQKECIKRYLFYSNMKQVGVFCGILVGVGPLSSKQTKIAFTTLGVESLTMEMSFLNKSYSR